jgi:hypothetical protein
MLPKFIAVLLSLFLVAPTFAQEAKPKPTILQPGETAAIPARPEAKQAVPSYEPQKQTWTTEGKVLSIIGAGMVATGIALAATSGSKASAVISGPGGYISVQGSSVNNGKRYGGVGLALAGVGFAAYGLTKRK